MLIIFRILMVIGSTIAGVVIAVILFGHPEVHIFSSLPGAIVTGIAGGLLLAGAAILLESFLKRISLGDLAVIAIGLALGAIIAWLAGYLHMLLPDYCKTYIDAHHPYFIVAKLVLYILFAYIGVIVAARGRSEFSLFVPRYKYNHEKALPPLVIDTSAIIDGRVVELYTIGFMRNKIIVPEFVLHELQIVSDSQVPLTRAKGRRGLETLKRLQDAPQIDIEVTGLDFAEVKEVDDKLMKLAKEIDATILTTDYNLEQVAKIQHIQCLNIFAVVNALKAPFIPGERLEMQIVKEGSESNQGVGFLDDGTMIVVSNGRQFIGKRIEVELVSMIQGASGRIFFAEHAENDTNASGSNERGSHDRGYHGSDRRRS